jgi:hypothetical protein
MLATEIVSDSQRNDVILPVWILSEYVTDDLYADIGGNISLRLRDDLDADLTEWSAQAKDKPVLIRMIETQG